MLEDLLQQAKRGGCWPNLVSKGRVIGPGGSQAPAQSQT